MDKKLNIKSILFDMDGVIVDSEIGAFGVFRDALASKGIDISLEELLGFVGESSRTIAAEIVKRYGLQVTPEEFKASLGGRSYYRDCGMEPMEGLVEFLKSLKADRVRTAVVSSTTGKNVLWTLNRLGLVRYFDVILCGDMVSETKPSPEGYLKAASLLGSMPEECVVIEDSPLGIQAGIDAGMTVVGFKGSAIEQDTSKAAVQVRSFREVIDLYVLWTGSKGRGLGRDAANTVCRIS